MKQGETRFARQARLPRPTWIGPVVALGVLLGATWGSTAANHLSGEWEAAIAVDAPANAWSVETEFTVELTFGDWTGSSRTVLELGTWKRQDLDIVGAIGRFALESDLRFEPSKDRFRDWITEIEWWWNEIQVTLTTKLTRSTDWVIIELGREWANTELDASLRWRAPTGSCAFACYDAGIELAFDGCGIAAELACDFDDDGFDAFVVDFSDLRVPFLPWATVDLEIARTLSATTIECSPDAVLSTPWCDGHLRLTIKGEFPKAPALLPISIAEASLTADIEAWRIEATAFLDPAHWAKGLYWLGLEADASWDIEPYGRLTLRFESPWSETAPGPLEGALTYQPTDDLEFTVSGILDPAAHRIDRLVVALAVAW